MEKPDFKKVPRSALIDALRNCSIGPTTLASQSKRELVDLAERAWSEFPEDRRASLIDHIATETAYQQSLKKGK